jgi:trehalose 6-phosphate phosphatase
MRHILSRPGRGVLAEFARSHCLVAFDFDGTLAPIVRKPEAARLRAKTRGLLRRLTELYPCAVISGRSRADVLRRLVGTGIQTIVGNHGAETSSRQPGQHKAIQNWQRILQRTLADLPGVVIEDKGLSLAVHYRKARAKAATSQAVLDAAQSLPGVRVVPAKQALNIMLPEAPHKGEALANECARLRCESALFVGDDDTDEDVFRWAHLKRLLTIRVGAKRKSSATYCLASQREIVDLILALIDLRSPVADE